MIGMVNLFQRLRQSKVDIEKEKAEIGRLYKQETISVPKVSRTRLLKNTKKFKKKLKSKISAKKGANKAGKKKMVTSTHKSKASSGKAPSPKAIKEKDLLKEAFNDLTRELALLRRQRRDLEQKLQGISMGLNNVQGKEIVLRNQISELMKKEAVLDKKKVAAKDKIMELSKKIDKVSSISKQLRD